ncbi:MAG TPA: hypothetical protein VEQ62_06370 [Stellaceae bacterium]|nr:hypothetical protein [Stellaceae bacterium]
MRTTSSRSSAMTTSTIASPSSIKGGLAPREPGERESGDFRAGKGAGLHHMAFTFKSLNELLDTYTLAQGKRYPSLLVHQSWFDDLDVLPRPGQQSGRALDFR